MSTRSLLLSLFCTLFLAGVAHADLQNFITSVNTSYSSDVSGFRARLADRFDAPAAELRMVIFSVDSPADAVVSLWLQEQSRLPIGKVLHCYQSQKQHDWKAIAAELGLSVDSALLNALQEGDLDWSQQVAGLP
jgi:hypothetical protein